MTPDTLRDLISTEIKSHLEPSALASTDVLAELSAAATLLAHNLAPTSRVAVNLTHTIGRLRTLSQLLTDTRKYSLDLAPKLLSSRGALVDLLIQSGVGHYLEFKGVEASYIYTGAVFEPVPTSKESIFTSQTIPLPTKRKLMKFLQFASDFDLNIEGETPELIRGYEDRTFSDLLRDRFSLSGSILDAILYGVALAPDPALSAFEGLTRTSTFLRSIGRFGPFAHLVPLYGGGSEIAQAFCRVCAVFGGTYVLGFPVHEMVVKTEENGQGEVVVGVAGGGDVLKANWIVCSEDYMIDGWKDTTDDDRYVLVS